MRAPLIGLVLIAALGAGGPDASARDPGRGGRSPSRARSACEGARGPLAETLTFRLRSAAFPGAAEADVAAHVPAGFDGTRRPGAVLYFHGWLGCVRASLSSGETPCVEGGDARAGGELAAQLDAARVNALLVAIELRVDRASGEPGRMAMPGGLRMLLDELLREHLAGPLGCALEVDALDRVVVVAHSGGYQAAAAVLQFGDLPSIREVVLLDALYGAEPPFATWVERAIQGFDPRTPAPRFVDLYTCCGGTLERSRSLARAGQATAARAGWGGAVLYEDEAAELAPAELEHAIVIRRVPRPHGDLPGAYVRPILEKAGFPPLAPP
ncbi:MAG: hypothetical protein JOZ69_09930 [Myxococcales bacterium]|nr:hypothetical protein [Myxococcales bacterium]